MSIPKVSIIMPSLNVANYIEECIESVIHQTLKEIEVICVDAGSNDGTLEILRKYEKRDCRIKVILSEKKSYGYQMNLGLDSAKGEYIGIVETDDWVDKNMFETLYNIAQKENVEMVKSNYYWYRTTPNKEDRIFENLLNCEYEKCFVPIESKILFTTAPSIWSGIYKRSMLMDKKIRFNETPGASFQDTSFHFMVCSEAATCYLTKQAFLHYRRDNEASSVNSFGKVFCVSDEMHYYEKFLDENIDIKNQIEKYYMLLKYAKYGWNYARLEPQFQWKFLELMHNEFSEADKKGLLDKKMFSEEEWNDLQEIIKKPLQYFERTCKQFSTRPHYSEVLKACLLKQATNVNPKVTVIIPTHNYEEYILETINSVLNQTMDSFEIVCVNDGSTDNTLAVLMEYVKDNPKITVLTQMNKGQGTARNVALNHARGEYVFFLDSDDCIESNALENLYTVAKERDLDILYFDGRTVYESEELEKNFPYYKTAYEYDVEVPYCLAGKELFYKMRSQNKYRVSVCLALFKRSYLEKLSLRFEEGVLHEDQYYSFECMLSAEKVSHVKDKYLVRRLHADSTVTRNATFRHFYGYLNCVIKMQRLIPALSLNENENSMAVTELKAVINMLKNCYNKLENSTIARDKLNDFEKFILETYINEGNNKRVVRKGKLWGAIECCKDHGVIYTLKYGLKKIRN